MNISSIFLPAVCAETVLVPKLLTALCRMTEPTETIANISPIERPVVSRSESIGLSSTSSLFLKTRKPHFLTAYTMQSTTERPCEMTVA